MKILLDTNIVIHREASTAVNEDTGANPGPEIAAAKFFVTEAAVRAAKKAVDVHGGYGCMMEYPVQRYYRDAETLIAGAGTSDIQRLIMIRKALG